MNFDTLNLRIRHNNLAYSLRPKLQWTIPDIPRELQQKLTHGGERAENKGPAVGISRPRRERQGRCSHLVQVQFVLPKSPVRYIILSGGGGEGKWEREPGSMAITYVPPHGRKQ